MGNLINVCRAVSSQRRSCISPGFLQPGHDTRGDPGTATSVVSAAAGTHQLCRDFPSCPGGRCTRSQGTDGSGAQAPAASRPPGSSRAPWQRQRRAGSPPRPPLAAAPSLYGANTTTPPPKLATAAIPIGNTPKVQQLEGGGATRTPCQTPPGFLFSLWLSFSVCFVVLWLFGVCVCFFFFLPFFPPNQPLYPVRVG